MPAPARRNSRFHITAAALCAAALGCAPGSAAQTNAPLASHWGAADYPDFRRGFQSGLTFLSFTEYDSDGKRFGVREGDSTVPYPETMGFNYWTLSYGNHVNSNS